MHKNIFLFDSGLNVVLQQNDNVKTEVVPTKINTVQQQTTPQKSIVAVKDTIVDKAVNVVQKPVNVEKTKVNVVQQPVKVQPQKAVKTVTAQPKQQQKSTPQPSKSTAKPIQKTQQQPKSQPVTKPAVTKPVKTAAQKEQEELIKWNKWRSDLQNRIMTDVKLPIVKQGTVFRFSFDVDKFGKITNVSTSSDDPNYTPYAIQYIAPVIRSYQGRDFMNFPAGSNRVTTTVSGAWKISDKTTYSTPADYKDVERIRN